MMVHRSQSVVFLLTLACSLVGTSLGASGAQGGNIFQAFTSHIQRQVEIDKRFFINASSCAEWFYKQERHKLPEAKSEGVGLRPSQPAPYGIQTVLISSIDCRSRYPGGLDAAREDFSRAQSTLSLSLTFYEFALVGDRDDDSRYNPAELRDILESFGLTFKPELSPATQLTMLSAQFDSVHYAGQFDVLMTGMGVLFEKGYRFTSRDVVALNRIMG